MAPHGKRSWSHATLGRDQQEPNDENRHPKRRLHKEIFVVTDNESDNIKGRGTSDNPIIFTEWTTGNLISSFHDEAIVIDDSEDESGDSAIGHLTPDRTLWRRSLSRTLSPLRSPDRSNRKRAVEPDDEGDSSEHPQHYHGLFRENASRTDSPLLFRGYHAYHSCASKEGSDDEGYQSEEEEGEKWTGASRNGSEESEGNYIILIDNEGEEYIYTHDWTCIKEEASDEIPPLTSTQESAATSSPSAPSSSQKHPGVVGSRTDERRSDVASFQNPGLGDQLSDWKAGDPSHIATPLDKDQSRKKETAKAKRARFAKLKRKKHLFYNMFGPRILDQLKDRLARFRPDSMEDESCWLYPGRIRNGQSTLETAIHFWHEGIKYEYTINMGFVALFVDNRLDQDSIQGIINHQWHASHLCGNWYCTNPRHIVAEPGPVNVGRNPCLKKSERPCSHRPQCLKHLKICNTRGCT